MRALFGRGRAADGAGHRRITGSEESAQGQLNGEQGVADRAIRHGIDDAQPPSHESSRPVSTLADETAMRIALDQAHNAWLVGEVPVGAVIVRDGQAIATGYNRPITEHDPTAQGCVAALDDFLERHGHARH